jgi:hypothetical protein
MTVKCSICGSPVDTGFQCIKFGSFHGATRPYYGTSAGASSPSYPKRNAKETPNGQK